MGRVTRPRYRAGRHHRTRAHRDADRARTRRTAPCTATMRGAGADRARGQCHNAVMEETPTAAAPPTRPLRGFHPPIEPYETGLLDVGDGQDAGDRQEDLVLARLVAVAAPRGAVPALAAGVAVIAVEAVASALTAPTTTPPALVVVAVGVIVAVTAPARTLLGLDDGGPGGVGQVPHESGLSVGVVLGRVGTGLVRSALLVLGGASGGLDAPAATAELIARGAIAPLRAAVGVAVVTALGSLGALSALTPTAACGTLLVVAGAAGRVAAGGTGPIRQIEAQVKSRHGLAPLGGAGGRRGAPAAGAP